MRRGLLAVAAILVMAGCGNDKTKPADVTKSSREAFGWTRVTLRQHGVSFERPAVWHYRPGTPPLLATMTSGEATIAVWRYPRTEPLPSTQQELDSARDALVGAAKARDPSFAESKAKGTRAAHEPAVVIVATETVDGHPRMVRSTHIYANGGEVVVDAYAPPAVYPKLEDPIFRRIVRTLKVLAPTG